MLVYIIREDNVRDGKCYCLGVKLGFLLQTTNKFPVIIVSEKINSFTDETSKVGEEISPTLRLLVV